MCNSTYHSDDINVEQWIEFLEEAMPEQSYTRKLISTAMMLIIFLVGLTGNLIVCIIIYTNRTMHTATNYYLFNLAVSDLIATFAIIIEAHMHYKKIFFEYSPIECKIHYFIVVALWNNGILVLTALAVERYVAIWHPMLVQSKPVWRRVTRIIVFLWAVAIAETIPDTYAVTIFVIKDTPICFTRPSPASRVIQGVLAVITFIIPLVIMIFVYAMIAIKVNESEKTNSKDKIFNHRENSKRINKLIVALTLSFLVCWLPFFCLRVFIIAFELPQMRPFILQWWSFVFRGTQVNSWFSIVLNPILFSLMSTKFRKALKIFWQTKLRKKPRVAKESKFWSKTSLNQITNN